MSNLEWFPSEWVDEVCPPSRSAPGGFIVPAPGGGFELGYENPDEAGIRNQPLKVGDVIEFVTCDRLPDVEATLRSDGSYELHGTIPPSHNVVIVDGNIDTLQESFDALIAALKAPADDWMHVREMIFTENETETKVTLEFADWSDPQPFLFEIEEGKPVFLPVPTQKN